jgi:hypothetical protein
MHLFESNRQYRSLKHIDVYGKVIFSFIPFSVDKGSFATDSDEIAEAVRKHPLYNIGFIELKDKHVEVPQPVQTGYIVRDNKAIAVPIEVPQAATQSIDIEKIKRIAILEFQILKPDGSFKHNAKKELVQEYKNLKGILQ